MRFLVVALMGALGCSTVGERAARMESVSCAADVPACLARVLAAHGGLGRHQALRYARYDVTDRWALPAMPFNPWPGRSGDLVIWSDRSAVDGAVEVVGTGHTIGMDEIGPFPVGDRPRGFASAEETALGTSWSLALPFRLGDDAVRIIAIRAERWRDFNVLALHVRFAPESGRTWRDAWTVYLDPESLLLVGARFLASEHDLTLDLRVRGFFVVEGLHVPRLVDVDLLTGAGRLPLHSVEVHDVKLWRQKPAGWPGARNEAVRAMVAP